MTTTTRPSVNVVFNLFLLYILNIVSVERLPCGEKFDQEPCPPRKFRLTVSLVFLFIYWPIAIYLTAFKHNRMTFRMKYLP